MTKYVVENPFLSLIGAIVLIILAIWAWNYFSKPAVIGTNSTVSNIGTRVAFNGNGNGNGNINGNGNY